MLVSPVPQADMPQHIKIELIDPPSPYVKLDNPFMGLSSISKFNGAKTELHTFLFSGISVSDWKNIKSDLVVAGITPDLKIWHLYINSPGGDAFQGLALADIVSCAKNTLRVFTHGHGIIASAALPVFAEGHVRIAAPSTIFMVHPAAIWKWPGQETIKDLKEQTAMMELLQDRYMMHIVPNSNLPREEWDAKEAETTWFTAEKAREWGLVTIIE
jgi:ATP-dependent protease ClpP protease subunit